MSFWLLLDYLQDFSAPDLRPLQERGGAQSGALTASVSQLRAARRTSGASGQSDSPGTCQGLWDNLTVLLLLELPNTSSSSRDKHQLGMKEREQW